MQLVEKSSAVPMIKRPREIKTTNIKECLYPPELSKVERLELEIIKCLYKKDNKNDEPGSTRYVRPNLPPHIDPISHVFGKRCLSSFGVGETLSAEWVHYADDTKYCESPWTQLTRNYKEPFDKYAKFGRPFTGDTGGSRTKRLLYWYKEQPETTTRDQPQHCYSLTKPVVFPDCASRLFRECDVEPRQLTRTRCIGHLNHLRRQLKKRGDAINFWIIKDHFNCLNRKMNKEGSCFASLELFYKVLEIVKIRPDKDIFEYILRDLGLVTENGEVYFSAALDLLDWKYEFPELSAVKDLPSDCLHYETTYNDMMIPYEVKRITLATKKKDNITALN